MKINFLQNQIKNVDAFNQGVALVKTALASINFPVEITITPTNKTFTGINIGNPEVGMSAEGVDPQEILALVSGQDDVAFLIYQKNQVVPPTTNPCTSLVKKGNTVPCQMSEEWFNNYPNVFCEYVLHELCHALVFLSGTSPDLTHLEINREWSPVLYDEYCATDTTGLKWYLYYLSTLIQKTMPTYKYFKPSEITGLQPSLVSMLDNARGFAGVPFVITSGFRTLAQNTAVGGVSGSAHTLGLAVDIAVPNDTYRLAIISGALKAGFTRLGVYQAHIHLDTGLSPAFPQNVCWISGNE